jgi:hypothetical protein
MLKAVIYARYSSDNQRVASIGRGRRHNAVPYDLIEKAGFLAADQMILDVP